MTEKMQPPPGYIPPRPETVERVRQEVREILNRPHTPRPRPRRYEDTERRARA